MHAEQSSVGKVLSNMRHVTADAGFALDQVDVVPGVSDFQRRLNTGHAAANDQRFRANIDLHRFQRFVHESRDAPPR